MLRRSQWPRGLRRRSAAVRLLRLWVRIAPVAWMFVCCTVLCVLSGRGLCDGLITRPEESYRLWWVVECDLETSWMRKPRHTLKLSRQKTNKTKIVSGYTCLEFIFVGCVDSVSRTWISLCVLYCWSVVLRIRVVAFAEGSRFASQTQWIVTSDFMIMEKLLLTIWRLTTTLVVVPHR